MVWAAGMIWGRLGMVTRQFLQECMQHRIARDPQLASQAIEQVTAPFAEVDDLRRQSRWVKADAKDIRRWLQ
jgi:hypothetical protein